MKKTYIESIQREIAATIRDLTQARAEIATGNYTLAQLHALNAAHRLTDAEKWRFAAHGCDFEITDSDNAQIYSAAVKQAQESARDFEYNPEHAQTVADLRAELKSGSDDAAQAVNDLISDNPNQATAWLTRDDIDRHADDMTDEQRAALMDYMRTEYELIDTSAEIANARETMDELEK